MGADEDTDELIERLEEITGRFWELSTSEYQESEGLTQVAVGMNAFLDEQRADPQLTPSRLRAVLDGLNRIADALEQPPEPVVPDDDTPTITVNADMSVRTFVDAFRGEAKKRLAGLSLSLSGVFDSDPQSIDQTLGHLHAIRGGAGMLELHSIAELAGIMEDVVVAARRADEDRWPVRPLLRGFATLESAIEDPESGYDNIIRAVGDELRGYLDDGREPTPSVPEGDFERAPATDIRKHPLQQRILVVDDVDTIAHSVGLILSELDIPVDVAHDGAEALELLENQPYSLVISDVAMPGMDGLALTQAIRDDEALSDLPVILLTALDQPEEREAGLDAGANDYIIKGSIGGGELLSRVNELLRTAPVVPSRPNEHGPFRNVLVVEDIETIAASIAFVLSEGPYEITLAHNGREALELLQDGQFDLVISDVEMPEMGGYELLENVRANPDLESLPVILLTGRDSDSDRDRAEAAGASRFLVKGDVGRTRLLEIVSDFFDE
jgi:CheY-like chemotaxis protein